MSEQHASPRDQATRPQQGQPRQEPGQEHGRNIVLTPLAPGSWPLILGVALAGLGPLGGFLAGSMAGVTSDGGSKFSAIYVYLFIGIAIGAVGVLMAGFSGMRIYRDRKTRAEPEAGAEAG